MADESRRDRKHRPADSIDRSTRREELLDAASAVIRRQGAAASMEDIAKEAGITKPIVYSHFGDKAGLADALAERVSAALMARFWEVRARTTDPRQFVGGSIDAWIGFIEDEPQIYRFLTQGTLGAGQRLADRRLVADIGRGLSRLMGELLRSAKADSGAAEPWAYGILGMVHVATEWWLDRQSMSRSDLVDYLTGLVWTGLSGNGLDADLPPLDARS